MTNHIEPAGVTGEARITLRTAGELAEALPYLLGFRPDDSVVLVALHKGRFGGRVRLGIPEREEDWPSVALQLARCLISECERRDGRPDSIVAFLCQDASAGPDTAPARRVRDRLRPLAQLLRMACGSLDVPVTEALCLSDGRYWSYCCPRPDCCPPEGNVIVTGGTSVMAATAAYAGIHVRGSVQEVRARLAPLETALVPEQTRALDAAAMDLVPRIFAGVSRQEVEAETLDLARRVMRRLSDAPCEDADLEADLRDDELVAHDEAASLILGLQDRLTRDRAAEWMEGAEAACALRLWRALARRCVGPYGEHAAAPLTLAGWIAWSLGDTVEADQALEMALTVDPRYKFAQLLNAARADGVDVEPVRRSLRGKRAGRETDPTVRKTEPNPDLPADENPDLPADENPDLPADGNPDLPAQGNPDLPAQGNPGLSADGNSDRNTESTGSRAVSTAGGTDGNAAGGTDGNAAGGTDASSDASAARSTEGDSAGGDAPESTLLPLRGSGVDPGMSRAARTLEAALRRRGERRRQAGTRPPRAGARASRRPSGGRRVGRQRTRDDG